MISNPDYMKPAHEAVFSRKRSEIHQDYDYGDVGYDKLFNESFREKLEFFWCNAALTMTVAVWVTNTEKNYQELGLESLQNRCKLRKLCIFYGIYKYHTSPYLHDLIL